MHYGKSSHVQIYSGEIRLNILRNFRLLNQLANTNFRPADSLEYIGKHFRDFQSESVLKLSEMKTSMLFVGLMYFYKTCVHL